MGDTIQGTYLSQYFGEPVIVLYIDSVLIENNDGSHYLKRFHFNTGLGENYFIEGVGHKLGFLEPPDIILSSSSQMYCYAQDGMVVYTFNFYDEENCDFAVSVEELEPEINDIIIFPNPASQNVSIVSNNNLIGKRVWLYSISGVLLLEEQMEQSPVILDISGLNKGLYLLKIESDIGFQKVKRLIIE